MAKYIQHYNLPTSTHWPSVMGSFSSYRQLSKLAFSVAQRYSTLHLEAFTLINPFDLNFSSAAMDNASQLEC